MLQAAKPLPLKELLDLARVRGHTIRGDQVVRWHKAGLVPRPLRRSLGRGRGTTSLGYPPEALDHVLAVSTLLSRGRRRDLKWVAWMMWLAGFPVTPAVRQFLQELAARFEDEVNTALQRMESDEPGVTGIGEFKRLASAPGLRAFGIRPNRFTGARRGEFDTALALVVRVLSGYGIKKEEIAEEHLDAIEHAIVGMRGVPTGLEAALTELRRSPTEGKKGSTPDTRRAAKAREDEMEEWRQKLRDQLAELSEDIGASLIRSALSEEHSPDLEVWREEFIAMWVMQNAHDPTLEPFDGPPPHMFLVWYAFRQHTMASVRGFTLFDGEQGQLFESFSSWFIDCISTTTACRSRVAVTCMLFSCR